MILLTGEGVCLSACWNTPRSRHPPEQTPTGSRHSLAQNMLGDTVNAWAVRILLECNLVYIFIFTNTYKLVRQNMDTKIHKQFTHILPNCTVGNFASGVRTNGSVKSRRQLHPEPPTANREEVLDIMLLRSFVKFKRILKLTSNPLNPLLFCITHSSAVSRF